MKLMILDGNSIVNRAYYGVRALTTRDGLFTNAIYGFLNILERLRAEEQPQALCVAFDLKAPTFRHEQYELYKATRHPMPEELAMQMPVLKDVLRAMNIPMFACEGWEADDVLGTAAKRCAQEGWDCVIVTGDRDSLQLIGEHVCVKLLSSRQGQTITTRYDEALFTQEYGFAPIRLIDLKALMGDSSDNIPGVAGVGPKTASTLLQTYGTLDGVYEGLPQIKESVRRKLEAGRESAYLSYALATIRCDAPVDFRPEACLVRPADQDALFALFQRLEFTKLIARYQLHPPAERLASAGPAPASQPETPAQAQHALDALLAAPCLSLYAPEPEQALYAACGGTVFCFRADVLDSYYKEVLERLFAASVRKNAYDCKTMTRRLLDMGLAADGFVFDPAVAAYLLDATQGSYELSRLSAQYLHEELSGEDANACCRAAAALYEPLQALLREQGMEKLFEEIELPLCAVLARMEHTGVQVDQMALIAFGSMLSGRIDAAQAEIFRFAGHEFNINSPKQLGQVLFEELALPPVKKTKSGYSTNADVLEKLRSRHPIIEAVLDYRMLTKLKSTYADGLLKQIGDDGRIHTTFQNLVTATGRLSSTEPNLQNIPVRTELGSEIRKMFVPQDGWLFVDADYSQIELRVLSDIADDANMQQAFRSGMDIHTATAAQVFRVPPKEVTPLMRRHAKAVNFGIVYGISEFSLSEDIGVSRAEARRYIDSYLETYSGVREYMRRIVEQARKDGYVSTLYGRRRALPELKSSNYNIRSFGERVALNMPIQGTAADLIKLAMLHVDAALRKQKLRARLVLQVHDELIIECPAAEAQTVQKLVAEQMEHVAKLKVPLLAEAKCGASWYEAK